MTGKKTVGYLRTGKVVVKPIRRSSDWLPEHSDSAFMNTGAKREYVVPRSQRSGGLIDPLRDLNDEEKARVARELGLKDADALNVMKTQKDNYWVNKPVAIDKNGLFLDMSSIADFISYKILEANTDEIAPSWEERYNKGTYKFALVFEDEQAKLENLKIDTKKEAWIMFGKIDGSVKKLSDFLWIYYLTNKDGKRLPNNPSLDYLKSEVGRLIEERPGEFMSILSDPNFETKALIQKAINIGLIQRDGQMFKIFGEQSSSNHLEGLIHYLLDERNNNIRISLIGKLEDHESLGVVKKPTEEEVKAVKKDEPDLSAKLDQLTELLKQTIEKNNALENEIKELKNADSANKEEVIVKKPGRAKKTE